MSTDPSHPNLIDLREAVEQACQPTFTPYILEGRKRITEMPRQWVLDNIEAVGRSALNFTDTQWGSWEYGRFLEVLDQINATELRTRLIREGLASVDVDVKELAELWNNRELKGRENPLQ